MPVSVTTNVGIWVVVAVICLLVGGGMLLAVLFGKDIRLFGNEFPAPSGRRSVPVIVVGFVMVAIGGLLLASVGKPASTATSSAAPPLSAPSTRAPSISATPTTAAPPTQGSGSQAPAGLTLHMTPDHGSTSSPFSVSGNGCNPGLVDIHIHLSDGTGPDYILSFAPQCQPDHSYQMHYSVDSSGRFTSVDASGTTGHVTLSPGTYALQARDATGVNSNPVTYQVE